MSFKELTEVLRPATIELPIRGKVYTFPGEVSGRTWLLIQTVGEAMERAAKAKARGEEVDTSEEVLSDMDATKIRTEMFGGLEDELSAAGVTSREMRLIYFTLLAYHLSGDEAAETIWNNGGEAPAPSRVTRRASTKAEAPAKSARTRGSRAG